MACEWIVFQLYVRTWCPVVAREIEEVIEEVRSYAEDVSAIEANRDVWDIGIDLLLALGEDWERFLELPYREKLNGDAVGESQRISRNSHIRLLRWLLRRLTGMLLLEEEDYSSHS